VFSGHQSGPHQAYQSNLQTAALETGPVEIQDMMARKPVKSSAIKSVGFDSASNTLELEFTGGAVHRYHNVSAEKYAAMMKAPSLGSHFKKFIHGKHPNTQV